MKMNAKTARKLLSDQHFKEFAEQHEATIRNMCKSLPPGSGPLAPMLALLNINVPAVPRNVVVELQGTPPRGEESILSMMKLAKLLYNDGVMPIAIALICQSSSLLVKGGREELEKTKAILDIIPRHSHPDQIDSITVIAGSYDGRVLATVFKNAGPEDSPMVSDTEPPIFKTDIISILDQRLKGNTDLGMVAGLWSGFNALMGDSEAQSPESESGKIHF